MANLGHTQSVALVTYSGGQWQSSDSYFALFVYSSGGGRLVKFERLSEDVTLSLADRVKSPRYFRPVLACARFSKYLMI